MSRFQQLHDWPRHWASTAPQAPALRDDVGELDYAGLWLAIQGTAGRLRDLGVQPGDRLMVVGENGMAQVILLLAASCLDAWCVLVNARLTAPEITILSDHARPCRVLFTDQDSDAAQAHACAWQAAERIALGVAARSVAVSPHDTLSRSETVAALPTERVAALVYTTGTTGAPKGVMLRHRNLMFVAQRSCEVRTLTAPDRVYGVLPQSHVYGLSSVLLATLCAGACLHLAARFDAGRTRAALADQGISVLQGVPSMFARLLAHPSPTPGGERWQAPALRALSCGGAPLDPGLKAAVEAATGLVLHNGYGLTECAPSVCHTLPGQPDAPGSVGPPLPGVELRIVGIDGRVLPDGDVGRLLVRSAGVMLGYYRAPERTAEVLDAAGWLDTGDLGCVRPDGSVAILGRTKEMIIRSGFKVYPLEVETVLNAFPGVLQSAVLGCPAGPGDEAVVAFVEAVRGVTLDHAQLADWLVARLAPYKRPQRVAVVPALPVTASGKILKRALQEQAVLLVQVPSPSGGGGEGA